MQSITARSRPVLRSAQLCFRYRYATDAPASAPPLLLKLRSDLKTAMKAKDTNRLNVLRGLLAEVTNAAKTAQPLDSDMKLLGLLRKRTNAATQAAKEFSDAGRQDLTEKENAAIKVLEEYAGNVETVGEDYIKEVVQSTIDSIKAEAQGAKVVMGDVLKKLLAPGGVFEGKAVEKSQVAKAVRQFLDANSSTSS
ncbi:GatB/YqeY domain-containing protein [Aureobasidium sp. EXF-12298]|nr:GatB/YqeY domain-containing protein [Aureobasidium sp. EXF-12298]